MKQLQMTQLISGDSSLSHMYINKNLDICSQ